MLIMLTSLTLLALFPSLKERVPAVWLEWFKFFFSHLGQGTYHILFVLRRFVYSLSLLFLGDYPGIQIILMIVMSKW
jgi:hypothetical protein